MLIEYSLQYGNKFIVSTVKQKIFLRLCKVPLKNIICTQESLLDILVSNVHENIGLCILPEDGSNILAMLKIWRKTGYNINLKYDMFIPFF
jgi:hypothetical protein